MMGSLKLRTNDLFKASRPSAGHDFDQAFAVEQAEKKLAAAKIRLVWEKKTFIDLCRF